MMGRDPCDATTLPQVPPDLSGETGSLRVGIPMEYLSDCDEAVRQAVHHAATIATDLGWRVSEVSLPLTEYALPAYYIISSVEAASNLARYDGVLYGYRAEAAKTGYTSMVTQTRTEGFGDEAQRRIMLGTFAASAGYEEQYYGQALRVRNLVKREFRSVFRDVDVVMSPVSPTTAWPFGERIADPLQMYLSDIYSVPAALAGLPAVVIPVAEDGDGLPIGIQFTGPYKGDTPTIRAARAMERTCGPHRPRV